MTASYGSVTFTGKAWRVSGEPFVRARLKRVFPRAPQQAAEWLELSATPENSRELKWFLDRYPMDVDRPDVMDRLAAQHIESERRLADLLAGHIPPAEIRLAVPAREYQLFADAMLQVKSGYLLADDLGLGKTVSAIIGLTRPENLPAVVVCPAHLPRQWRDMIKRFAPQLTTHILKKGTPYDLTPNMRGGAQRELIASSTLPDVIITSYHKLRGWAESLKPLVKHVIYDECQALRSPGTEIYEAAKHLRSGTQRALGLSATPIYGYGHEFHHVIDVLLPGALGEYSEFIREYCVAAPGEKSKLKDPKEFGSYLRREGIMLRRTRAEVGRELPPLTKIVHMIDSDRRALDELQGQAVELARVILRHNEQFRGEKMQAAGEFDALMRQATGIAKAPYVIEFVKLLLDSGEPIVLFGWHRAVYDMWMEGLKEANPVLYTGSESPTQKAESLRKFLSGESQLLIMSLRSGAGVDGLQGYCKTAVVGEFDWSPQVHDQCFGRVHRDGADEACFAYFLVSEEGADPIMAEVLGLKREQSEGVRNPNAELVERIDNGETNLRRLAQAFLARRGESVHVPDVVEELTT